jgi:hypothetical protein
VSEHWYLAGPEPDEPPGPTTAWLDADDALRVVEERAEAGELMTMLGSDSGRTVMWVTNRRRVMLVLVEGVGDPGMHAVDPGAEGESNGFVVDNGQEDTYVDADTVEIDTARRLLRSLVATGTFPQDAQVVVDR